MGRAFTLESGSCVIVTVQHALTNGKPTKQSKRIVARAPAIETPAGKKIGGGIRGFEANEEGEAAAKIFSGAEKCTEVTVPTLAQPFRVGLGAIRYVLGRE